MAPTDVEMNHEQEKPDEISYIKDSTTLGQTDKREDTSSEGETSSPWRHWTHHWTRYGKHVVYAVIWLLFTG